MTLYEFKLDPKVKVNRIRSLEDDIAMKVESIGGIRIIAPMPGRGTIGIEVPNRNPRTVGMKEMCIRDRAKMRITQNQEPTDYFISWIEDDWTQRLLKEPGMGAGRRIFFSTEASSDDLVVASSHNGQLRFALQEPKMCIRDRILAVRRSSPLA